MSEMSKDYYSDTSGECYKKFFFVTDKEAKTSLSICISKTFSAKYNISE